MFGASDGVWVSGGSFSLRCAALTNRLHWSCEMGHFERQNAKQRRKTANFQTVLMIKQLEGGRHVLSNLCDVKKANLLQRQSRRSVNELFAGSLARLFRG